jgi:hypothetical protein
VPPIGAAATSVACSRAGSSISVTPRPPTVLSAKPRLQPIVIRVASGSARHEFRSSRPVRRNSSPEASASNLTAAVTLSCATNLAYQIHVRSRRIEQHLLLGNAQRFARAHHLAFRVASAIGGLGSVVESLRRGRAEFRCSGCETTIEVKRCPKNTLRLDVGQLAGNRLKAPALALCSEDRIDASHGAPWDECDTIT